MLNELIKSLMWEASHNSKAKELLRYLKDYEYLRDKYMSFEEFEYNSKPMAIIISGENSQAYIGFAAGLSGQRFYDSKENNSYMNCNIDKCMISDGTYEYYLNKAARKANIKNVKDLTVKSMGEVDFNIDFYTGNLSEVFELYKNKFDYFVLINDGECQAWPPEQFDWITVNMKGTYMLSLYLETIEDHGIFGDKVIDRPSMYLYIKEV